MLLLAVVLSGVGGFLARVSPAQSINLRTGQSVQTQGMRRDGANVFARVQTAGGTVGEVSYPVANIAQIDFPEPPQLRTAGDLLGAGKASDAAAQLTPALAYYVFFRDIKGNWWVPLALLQVDAMSRLGRDREVDALAAELSRMGDVSPESLRTVKFKQAAAMNRRGEYRQALAALKPLVEDKAAPPNELGEGWLAVGSAHLALRDYKDALLAFLHVPVYVPDHALLMPAALLGSAKAYVGLVDKLHAQSALQRLVTDYPNAPEAAEARDRLQKLAAVSLQPPGS